jgi:hypothetical protein
LTYTSQVSIFVSSITICTDTHFSIQHCIPLTFLVLVHGYHVCLFNLTQNETIQLESMKMWEPKILNSGMFKSCYYVTVIFSLSLWGPFLSWLSKLLFWIWPIEEIWKPRAEIWKPRGLRLQNSNEKYSQEHQCYLILCCQFLLHCSVKLSLFWR